MNHHNKDIEQTKKGREKRAKCLQLFLPEQLDKFWHKYKVAPVGMDLETESRISKASFIVIILVQFLPTQ